ncbi:MAG TPA: HNH endonuclease, partial [Alcanivorax sp.]|nr:HNH endonuclease [Alcanivorax sp.]
MSERILRLDKTGTPVEWLDWQVAFTLYARG